MLLVLLHLQWPPGALQFKRSGSSYSAPIWLVVFPVSLLCGVKKVGWGKLVLLSGN
jgi:hypothetical protein